MAVLDYNSSTIEQYAINKIIKLFDSSYKSLISCGKTDDFDFVSTDKKKALEITAIIPKNEIEASIYEKGFLKGKTMGRSKVSGAIYKSDKSLIAYDGGDMSEIRSKIISAINKKITKRNKRVKKYTTYELCLCISDSGLFDKETDFQFLLNADINKKTGFDRLFLITSNHFLVIENNVLAVFK